ncbi:SIMPL domain-containing protein [Chloroflexota bacterium]
MRTKYLIFAALAILALALSACGPTTITQAAPVTPRTLNVTGQGIVYLTPDIVYINIGVNTQRENASEAVDINKKQTTAVIQAIKDFGVDAKDIRTTNFSIWSNPLYDDLGQVKSSNYSVDNTVSVTVRDLDKLGDLLDAAIVAGANSIYSIQFDVEDKTEANKEARAQAVADAKLGAEELAAVTGVELVSIDNISYYENGSTPYYMDGRGGGGESAASSVPIQPGQLAISVTVNLTYSIK